MKTNANEQGGGATANLRKTEPKRRFIRAGGRFGFAGGLMAVLLVGCGKKHEAKISAEAALPVVTVRVQRIEAAQQTAVEEVVGTVQAKLQATIEAKVSGRVTALPVTLGQTVKAGDVLVELATQEIQARLDQANATFRQAETEFNRFTRLLAQAAVTRSEFDTAETRLTVAKAAVAEADALAGYAKIVAPFAGVVARKLADVGDLAMPGKPLLELEGRAGLRLVADVPAMLAGGIKSGEILAVRVDPVTNLIAGTVAEVSPAADPASRTVRVKVDLPAAPGLRAGQFGRLAVPVNLATFLIVPASALVQRGQLELLFVATDGKAQMRIVRTGKQAAQGVEILAGLVPGESVVIEGADRLRDGQPVSIQNAN
ncbi:MAG: efflux RND transporter periplasmic adaptor subunit [Verrucomicrobiota bacterium]|nr:efflux RND transporter periplasmic adaptor subunit [Verrucomicrobiota bacterium]